MITTLDPAPRIALIGLSGCGKSTAATATAALLADHGIDATVLKLAAPLYELQHAYYQTAGVAVDQATQDQQLLHRIATDLRQVSPTALLDRFRRDLGDVPKQTAVITDDLRDADIDAPGLRESGFVLVRVTCDEQVRTRRLTGRGDLSHIDELAMFGPALEAMQPDHVIDTTDTDPQTCAREILEAVGCRPPAALSVTRRQRAASTGLVGARDTTHVWGEYVEVTLNPVTLLREIQVYPGGRTSIHRHAIASELNVIAGGAVRLFVGRDPHNLSEHVRGPGEVIHVAAGMWHAVAFEHAESTAQPCARFFEVVYSHDTPDDIERFAPALPGARPTDAGRGFSGWIAQAS